MDLLLWIQLGALGSFIIIFSDFFCHVKIHKDEYIWNLPVLLAYVTMGMMLGLVSLIAGMFVLVHSLRLYYRYK